MKTEEYRIHRVGSITCGVVLVAAGILYLLATFWKTVPLQLVFHLWPVILILLGLEILLSRILSGERMQYDKTAIWIMVMMVLFSMFLACVDVGLAKI